MLNMELQSEVSSKKTARCTYRRGKFLRTSYLKASPMKNPATTSGAPFLPLPGCIVAVCASIAACPTEERPFVTLNRLALGQWSTFQCRCLHGISRAKWHTVAELTRMRSSTWGNPWLCCTAMVPVSSMQCSPAASDRIASAQQLQSTSVRVLDRSRFCASQVPSAITGPGDHVHHTLKLQCDLH